MVGNRLRVGVRAQNASVSGFACPCEDWKRTKQSQNKVVESRANLWQVVQSQGKRLLAVESRAKSWEIAFLQGHITVDRGSRRKGLWWGFTSVSPAKVPQDHLVLACALVCSLECS